MQGFPAGNYLTTGATNSITCDSNPGVSCTQPKLILECKHCQKQYKLIAALKRHEDKCSRTKNLHTKHPKRNRYYESEDKKAKNVCQECGETFKYAKILKRHEAIHQGKTYWCKLCMENFATYEDEVLHKMNKHPNKSKRRKCKFCPDLNLNSEEEYLYHITELHKGQFGDYYMCSCCGRQFKTKSELTHHNNSKCGTIKQYKCKICQQDLMTAGSLHNHMLRHTGERSSMCGFCGKLFLTPGQLKVHERTHTQEKPFVCNICGKGFCHRQSLITHSTLHTGVKPYLCDNCGHSFSCVGNLLKHRRTHADTCGSTVLTSHLVENPMTKMRVKINTPRNSKLKALRKERELQEKLDAYKKKLVQKSDAPADPVLTEVVGVNNGEFSMSSHNSDCSYQYGEDDQGDNCQRDADLAYDFNVKTEVEQAIDDVSYIPNGFLNTKMLEMVDPLLDSPAKKLEETEFFKQLSNNLQEYSNQESSNKEYSNQEHLNKEYSNQEHSDQEYSNPELSIQEHLNKEYSNPEHSNQEHLNKEYSNQEYSNQEHSNQEHLNNEYSNQEHLNKEYSNQEHLNKEYSNPEHSNQEHLNKEYSNQEHLNKEYSNQEHSNQEHLNKEYSNQEHLNKEYSNQEYSNQEHSNKEYSNQEHSNKEYSNLEHSNQENSNHELSNQEDSNQEYSDLEHSNQEHSNQEFSNQESSNQEHSNHKHSNQEYSNKIAVNDGKKVDSIPIQVKSIFSTTHFLCHLNSSPAIEHNSNQNHNDPLQLNEQPNDCYNLDNYHNQMESEDQEPKIALTNKQTQKGSGKIRKLAVEKITEEELEEFIKLKGFDRDAEGLCRYCKKSYTNLRWLVRHEKNHEKKLQEQPTDIKSTTTYRCSCCKVGFESRDECKAHQKNMHADVLTCQDCDKLFSNVDSLRSHQNIFHKGLPRKVYVYICERCGLQFRQRAFLTHHENTNCGAGPVYVCDICGKGFSSVHTCRSHLRIHDPKKRFLCKFCGKSFRWKGQLTIHERSHTGEKPFKCLYCPKAFAYRESLITHSSMHTGVKPHLCEACGSRFSCVGNLIKHRGTHASTCGWWYSRNQ